MPDLDKQHTIDAEARKLLESLTPGGSEFSNNPQACHDFIKDRLIMMAKLALRNKELREQLGEKA
jgi:hypothetical protein